TEERTTSANDNGSGAVTVASNLPSGDAGGSGSSSQSQNSETRERTNFEVSETTREVLRSPGAVKRLTVAVLIDGVVGVDASGNAAIEPRPEEELDALHDLVAAAVGFDADRGDVITLRSMQFEPLAPLANAAGGSFLASLNLDVMSIVQLAVLAIVSLALGLFVIRPILTSGGGRIAELPAPPRAEPAQAADALTGEIDDGDYQPRNVAVVSDRSAKTDAGAVEADPVTRLRQMISERQEESVEILRGWMEESEEENV
ncbi:MAG: flagellar M-ring protein FliF C-terminal domain-containing protein, partial [Albidovulum sp.]